MSVIDEIASERRRQVDAEGWTAEHDDEHDNGEMAIAAGLYAIHAGDPSAAELETSFNDQELCPRAWPWQRHFWKPKNPRRDLIRAGALIVAEIERWDRLDAAAAGSRQGNLADLPTQIRPTRVQRAGLRCNPPSRGRDVNKADTDSNSRACQDEMEIGVPPLVTPERN